MFRCLFSGFSMLARPLRLDIDNSYNVQKFDILCSGEKEIDNT